MKTAMEARESRLETIISYLLISGVVLSLLLEVAGIVLFHRQYSHWAILLEDRSMFIRGRNFFAFLFQIFKREGMRSNAVFLMVSGVAVLILTPYLRVAASFLYFSWRRDFKYVLITAFVLLVITLSLALH